MRRLLCGTAAVLAVALWAGAARAQEFNAYDNTVATGLQNFGNSLGLDFDVNTPIIVTDLGAFDNGDTDNLDFQNPDGVTVAIFDRTTQVQVGQSLSFSPGNPGTRVNANVFKELAAPINLPAGGYTLVAFNAPNFNSGGAPNTFSTTNDGGGLISFVGTGRFGLTAGGYPTNADGGPANRYNIGSFIYTAVPEPASLGVLALGGAGLLARRRRA